MKGARKRKLKKSEAVKLWRELQTHVRYSFNRAHAVSYTVISWEMMWWKVHYPVQFFAAAMELDPYEFQTYLFDAAEHDIKVVPPHVNISSTNFAHREDTIYLPLSSIKYLGKPGAAAIVKARESLGGKFPSYAEFDKLVERKRCNSRARFGLYAVGGFEGLKGSPLDAGIDTTKELLSHSDYEKQQAYLGAVLPSAEILRKITRWSKKDKYIAGIVKEKRRKVSKFGPYIVYRLVPTGTFWVRDGKELEEGQIVAAKVHQRTGRAIEVKEL